MSEYKPCACISFDEFYELGDFGKHDLSFGTGVVKSCGKSHFEFRKKRPYERGRKKRRKGKRDPISLLCNGARAKNCNSEYLLD